jgi:hypothetical protein
MEVEMRPFWLAISLVFCATAAHAAGPIIAHTTRDFCRLITIDCATGDLDSCYHMCCDGAVPAGTIIGSRTGRFCYKRSNDPSNCSSGMQAKWNCFTITVQEKKLEVEIN